MENNDSLKNWPLVGNRQISGFLAKSASSGKVAGAYLFSGPEDLGKTEAAFYFARILLCTGRGKSGSPCGQCDSCRKIERNGITAENDPAALNGDFHFLEKEKEKKNIAIEAAREFIRAMNMGAFLGGWKAGIIKEADRMSEESMNALLKTLEEPKKRTTIILTASSSDSLPETIVSRCQILNFSPVSFSDIYDYLVDERGANRTMAKNIASLALGRPALALKFLEDKDFSERYRQSINFFFEFLGRDAVAVFRRIEEETAGKTGAEFALRSGRMIDDWQAAARDILLIRCHQKDLIRNRPFENELEKQAIRFEEKKLVRIISELSRAKDYLKANVSPRLVLENFAIGI